MKRAIIALSCLVLLLIIALAYQLLRGGSSNHTAQASLTMHAGKTETETNAQFISTTDSGGLASRSRFRIDADPADELAMDIARQLEAALSSQPGVTQITLNPPDPVYADVFVRIETLRNDLTASVGKRERSMEVRLEAGSEPFSSNSTLHDHLSPPLYEWFKSGEVSVKTSFEGVMLGDQLRAKMVSDVTGKMLEALESSFDAMADQADMVIAPGELPPYAIPESQAFTPPAALSGRQPKLIASGNRPFLNNESYWTFTAPAGDQMPLRAIRDSLKAEGWYVSQYEEGDHEEIPMLRLSKSPYLLEIWPEKRDQETTQAFAEPRDYVIRLRHRLTKQEYRAFVDRAMAEKAPLEIIHLVNRWWSTEQRQTFYERVAAKNAINHPEQMLEAIDELLARGENEQALTLVNRTYVLSKAASNSMYDDLKRLGRMATGDPAWLPALPTTRESLADFGIPWLEPGETAEASLSLDGYALFAGGDESNVRVLYFTVQQSDNFSDSWRFSYGAVSDNSISWSNNSLPKKLMGGESGMKLNGHFQPVQASYRIRQPDPDVEEFTVEIQYKLESEEDS